MESEELGGTVDMALDMDMQTTTDPIASYMNGSISMMGMNLDMEMYGIVEGNQMSNYIGMMNQWMVQKVDYNEEAMNTLETAEADLLANLDTLALAEETEDVNDTEAYIITGTLEGKDVQDLLGSTQGIMGNLTGEGDSMDLTGISVDLKYAISKADKMPLYMECILNGFDSMVEDSGISFNKYTVKIEYTGFDTVDSITVPQDVIDAAIDITE